MSELPPSYPIPAYLNFAPGGLSFKGGESEFYSLRNYSIDVSKGEDSTVQGKPESLISRAKQADDVLRGYALLYGRDPSAPHYLPSLSVLAEAVFGKLTGVEAGVVKKWADAMVLHYLDITPEQVPNSEQEIHSYTPTLASQGDETVANAMKRLKQQSEDLNLGTGVGKPRPCGYVFKRGDIAWNCRTCQTDPTCVICDTCFHNSNHDGHEVYFHRTTPGGCCDCGDVEAWKIDGCCPLHRPTGGQQSSDSDDDPEEAVKIGLRGLKEGLDILQEPPTKLPPKFVAALGVVIGAAVHCIVQAVDGAGIGADPSQWRLRWAEEASKIINQISNNEESYLKRHSTATPAAIVSGTQDLPTGYRLDLRLHNDDVHTFDEVIEALHEPRHRRPGNENSVPLVAHKDDASDMTHDVDSDGQVTVKSYSSIAHAMQGYRQLKSKGLHCAVVSTAQVDCEHRARALTSWLTEIASAHQAAATLIVHALVQVKEDQTLAGISVWQRPHMIPSWSSMLEAEDEVTTSRRRFFAFPPHLESSFMTRPEAETLHRLGLELHADQLLQVTGTDPQFYTYVPFRLPSDRYKKSPHALWGTLPSAFSDNTPVSNRQQLLYRLSTGQFDETAATMKNKLEEQVYVIDTDMRKQQESELILSSVFPHRIPGLHMISGAGTVKPGHISQAAPPIPNPMEYRNLLATTSFRAPISPLVLLLLLDPYPTKQVRLTLHSLFLSLLVDSRFKCRVAAALGAVAYRSLSTLFCAGVGTEADTPLGFTVQIFTAGSLVRALGSAAATEKLLRSDQVKENDENIAEIGVFCIPIAHSVVRCIHTNLLGSTKEVNMILNNSPAGVNNDSQEDLQGNERMLPTLTYHAGEHPLLTQLAAAPDDGFLDSRSTRHKRLPHLLRDLEYILETPGTAFRLLLPSKYPIIQDSSNLTASAQHPLEPALAFATTYARLLHIAQGMDTQKRKISGGHVEYEKNRWLEAFGLSLNLAGTRDALSESLTNSCSYHLAPFSENGSHLLSIKEAVGNLLASLLKELKLWLYREGMLETGLPLAHGAMDHSQVEALQRSTLHVSGTNLDVSRIGDSPGRSSGAMNISSVALSCATGIKMTESQLEIIESALKRTDSQRQHNAAIGFSAPRNDLPMGDWLRIPHSPLGGDTLSFHLPLHRSIAKTVRSICYVAVPQATRTMNPQSWWKLPVLDEYQQDSDQLQHHPLVSVIRSTLRSSNCRVVWSAGPECTSVEAQKRRSRAKHVSANIASAKIIHSMADHPLRCLTAAQQIERHLWARNGSSIAGMALNYSSSPLCRSFRDLDITLVQLAAAGLGVGLGARRVFSLLLSRSSMDGYLCDPERRPPGSTTGAGGSGYSSGRGAWIDPPRLQDKDHAVALSESFFTILCILVTEVVPPPPLSPTDDSSLRKNLRRELLHSLAAEPRSHSEAMEAATSASSRRDESAGISGGVSGGGALGDVFTEVLREVGKQKNQGSARAASGPSSYELKAECCEEYDPTFYHLRRQDHQHAMDTISRLRRQKAGNMTDCSPEGVSFPIVCPPPQAHPRFLPCRLLLHLSAMDAALRRALLFAATGGSWIPPRDPSTGNQENTAEGEASSIQMGPGQVGDGARVSATAFKRSFHRSQSGSKKGSDSSEPEPFSSSIVASSSVSCLEVVQLLTLQIHTLEECAALHRTHPNLDDEAKSLSASLSINSYLGRMIKVPESLVDVWAFRPYPSGPLESKGSGQNRGSILGFLILLYEHRAMQGSEGASSTEAGDDGHGGARALTESGMKWILRFIDALVSGASSVSAAIKSATTGLQIKTSKPNSTEPTASWIVDQDINDTVCGMLRNLPDLWPKEEKKEASEDDKQNAKSRESRKAAQQRVMDMMRARQKAFAATIAPTEESGNKMEIDNNEEDKDLCIICRCDDNDGENNGPLGYLGHVQRSRYSQMRFSKEVSSNNPLYQTYRVVGHRGCQLRKTEAMDSEALACLPTGSIVTVEASTVSEKYDVLSRRVFVKSVSASVGNDDKPTEGWASIQSSEGYIILSPLANLCFSNTRWGSTRPIIRQCGHAAHLKCVETHTLSLHQRAAGEQPYDGRFAANIEDGEFLCPLCKQLSNILIPRDGCARDASEEDKATPAEKSGDLGTWGSVRDVLQTSSHLDDEKYNKIGEEALRRFGESLKQAMVVPWERASPARKKEQQHWHRLIQRWDYEDAEENKSNNVMALLRQQHISWSCIGHTAASAEACSRSVLEKTPFGDMSQTSDPWSDYNPESMDSHPQMLELRRTMTASSGLVEILIKQMNKSPGDSQSAQVKKSSLIGSCLLDILYGSSWLLKAGDDNQPANTDQLVQWSQLTALMSSMPCHVSLDGTLSQRHEARAAAAMMWVLNGYGSLDSYDITDQNLTEAEHVPPTPAAIRQIQKATSGSVAAIPRGWGTMSPFESCEQSTPFRPGVAAAFLYTPLLAWDLNTLTGAVFSTMLANSVANIPSSTDLLFCARVLLVGRMIQAIAVPGGFSIGASDEEDDILLDFWTTQDIEKEGIALSKLFAFCKEIVAEKPTRITNRDLALDKSVESSRLHGAVGRAMLPFARSLILVLRSCWSAIRQRQKRERRNSGKDSECDKVLNELLVHDELMSFEDGLLFVKEIGGPLPSQIVQDVCNADDGDSWWALIERWLIGAVVLESHHGSRGKSIIPKLVPNANFAPEPTQGINDTAADSLSREENEEILSDAQAGDQMDTDVEHEILDSVEMIDDFEIDNEMVDIVEHGLADALNGVADTGVGDAYSSDDGSCKSASSKSRQRQLDREFACVARSPIIPHQPSLFGTEPVAPGTRGAPLEVDLTNTMMYDMSVLGMVHQSNVATKCLIRLPKSFVELYSLVNKVKGCDGATVEEDDGGNVETAICLITGCVMKSGSPRRPYNRAARPPGSCTLHARQVGSGIGIFFLVQKCTVLLMHNNKSAYSASLYVDQHGEEDPGLRRGRPLFLNEARYDALERLWRESGIPREVARIRSTSDRVIRDNWY